MNKTILPPKKLKYKNVWRINFKVNVMDIREIVAEKIRAMNDRARYRDFYDFVIINKSLPINLNEIISLVKIKEIRKPISPANILNNWQIAKIDKQNENLAIHFSKDLSIKQIESSISKLNFPSIK